MYQEIPYSEAILRYPQAVVEVMDKLRGSKSKLRDAKPEELKWGFGWGVAIEGVMNGNQFLEMLKSGEPPPRPKKMTEDETVADYARRASVALEGRIGRWYGRSGILRALPKEIEDQVRKGYRDDAAEDKRFSSLTQEEQDEELRKDLGFLFGQPGFVALGVQRRKR